MSTQNTKGAVKIYVNGRKIEGANGDSIAGVLHKNGIDILGRSEKYHRPRGYHCGFGACGSCELNCNGQPGTVSCITPARDGDRVELKGGFPSVRFDLLRAADAFKVLLPAGFQFKLFAKQPKLAALAARFMGVLAGRGRMPSREEQERAMVKRVEQLEPDVLVIGGGMVGLQAALAAVDASRQVLVVDPDFAGGRSRVDTESISADTSFESTFEEVRGLAGVSLVEGTVIGALEGVFPVISGSTRLEVRPKRVIIATGSYEVPWRFANNDRPGVLLGDGALKLAEIEGASLGRRVVVATDRDRGHGVAERLQAVGGNVVGVIDRRDEGDCTSITEHGLPVLWNSEVTSVTGLRRVRAVRFTVGEQRRRPRIETLKADALVVVGRRRPAEEFGLYLDHSGKRLPMLKVGGAGQFATEAGIAEQVTDFLKEQQ